MLDSEGDVIDAGSDEMPRFEVMVGCTSCGARAKSMDTSLHRLPRWARPAAERALAYFATERPRTAPSPL